MPLTACSMALVAAVLNLVYELFGPEPSTAPRGKVASSGDLAAVGVIKPFPDAINLRALFILRGSQCCWRSFALIGFIPAISMFIFAYMRGGFARRQ